jgi:peptidoglycan endopeptidase LytE
MNSLKHLFVAVLSLLFAFSIASNVVADTSQTARKHHKHHVKHSGKKSHLRHGKAKTGQPAALTNEKDVQDVYVVKKGDTVFRIARRFGIKTEDLRERNGLTGSDLKPGQKLSIAKRQVEKKEEAASKTEPSDDTPEKNAAPTTLASASLEEVKNLSTSEYALASLTIKERLVLFAKKMLDFPYRFGGTGAFGIDCSAYVQKMYSFIGQSLPRSAREQFTLGESVNKDELTKGDLVFFRTYASFPSHVGIYLGNNLFIHASSLSKKVTIDSLDSPYYVRHFIGAKRILPEDQMQVITDELSLK